ncbi:MAG: hypothetical protein Q8920_03485 [Bacillota bacterium]|nr:hypothetical protein [Bacillota bacterium]
MERKIPELEEYLKCLRSELKLEAGLAEEICLEINESLYDKFNEFLIKGYGINYSISNTIEAFEDPKKLAGMFNHVHRGQYRAEKAIGLLFEKKAVLAAAIATLLMAFII